jgi:hypothetical protein
MNALIYAGHFWDKVCHDGRIGTKHGYPQTINGVTLQPGLPFSQIGAISGEDDCAHFISCCVGTGVANLNVGGVNIPLRGGGIPLHSPIRGVYGQTHVAHLVGNLLGNGAKLVTRQFIPKDDFVGTTRRLIQQNLQPGDVLAYASKPDPNHYEHACLVVGPANIACHTRRRMGNDYTDVPFGWVTLLKLP